MHLGSLLALSGSFDLDFFRRFVLQPTGALLGGLGVTVFVAVAAQTLGVALGVLAALTGMARNPIVRGASALYVWFFRGTPVLVQMFLLYYGTPYLLGVDIFPNPTHLGPLTMPGNIIAGMLALGVNEGAYMSEIVRAGILSVDPGQNEAAKSLGMTPGLTMRRIVLPQAMRVIIPPLGNEFNNMIKTTSLMSVIAVSDLFRVADNVRSATFKQFEPLLGISIYYLILTTIWGVIQGRIERKFGAGQANAAPSEPGARGRLVGFGRGRSGESGIGSLGGH